MRFIEYLKEQEELSRFNTILEKEETLLTELKINFESEIYKKLVNFVKTKTAEVKDMAMFLRYFLVDKYKKLTNKGLVLVLGGSVNLTEPAEEYTNDMISNAAIRLKNKVKGNKDVEDFIDDIPSMPVDKNLSRDESLWYTWVNLRKKWEPRLRNIPFLNI